MTDKQEFQDSKQTVSDEISYRRRRREVLGRESLAGDMPSEAVLEVPRQRRFRVGVGHHAVIVGLSVLLAATTIVWPFLSALATEVQSFHLYTGQMMALGQLPYGDVISSAGFLYYALIAASSVLGNPLLLLVIQGLAYYVSGIYLYKLVLFYTNEASAGLAGSFLFYILNIGLGFGGLYPMQLAMPFVLLGLWFIVRYFAGLTSDEGFVAYGFFAAISLLMEPRTVFFWLIAFLFLSIFNISRGLWARGFYQNLGIILGLIVVFYTVGYFIFNMELLLPYLSQALGYHFTQLAWGTSSLWQTAVFQLGLAFFSGLLLGVLAVVEHLRKATSDHLSRSLIAVTALVYVVLAIFSQSWSAYLLLPALPFGLIVTVICLDGFQKQRAQRRNSHRRKEDEKGLLATFLNSHLYGPLIIALLSLAWPVYHYTQEQAGLVGERQLVADYIKAETTEDEEIIVIDDRATIYQLSQRRTATRYPISHLYQATVGSQTDFEDEFLENKAPFVVVATKETLSSTQQRNLEKYYREEILDGISHFHVYQLK